jgi:ribosome biogenesis SPOUT family RNA methylase Rps3
MDVKSGLVIGDCQPRHRAREFIAFLRRIDQIVKKHLASNRGSETTASSA